eukprot:348099_1
MSSKEYRDVEIATYDNISEYRWCQFIIFRDPRDRILSKIYYNPELGRDKEIQFHLSLDYVNERTSKLFSGSLIWWNKYYSFYHGENLKTPHLYYIHWYHEMKSNTFGMIRDLSEYIGVSQYLSDDDIHYIINETSFKNTVSKGQAMHQRKGKHCAFKDELYPDMIRQINQQMLNELNDDVIQKLNKTCLIIACAS